MEIEMEGRSGSSGTGGLAGEDLGREAPGLGRYEAHVVEGVAAAPPAPLRPPKALGPRRHRAAVHPSRAADRALPGRHVGVEAPAAALGRGRGRGRGREEEEDSKQQRGEGASSHPRGDGIGVDASKPYRYQADRSMETGKGEVRRKGNSRVVVDDKSPSLMASRDRDRELLIPVADRPVESEDNHDAKASSSAAAASPSSASAHVPSSSRTAFYKVIRSWTSKKFITGCVILFPIAITFYITWWFIHFVDGFFSPIYAQLGIDIFGLGFVTSITFIFLVGLFMSSWLGASVLSLGEWFIKRMPFIRHIYNASKQISSAVSPDQNKQAFKEVVIIRHPRVGEYAFGFITSTVLLQTCNGEEELCCVYVPTNHLYIGDVFLVNSKDVIQPNLSVSEGIEIVVSGGMSMPQILTTLNESSVP